MIGYFEEKRTIYNIPFNIQNPLILFIYLMTSFMKYYPFIEFEI